MPQTPTAKKRLRQNVKRRQRNRAAKSRVATLVRRFRQAIEAGDMDKAQEAFRVAQKGIAQTAAKGILHKNTASRRVAHMARMLDAAKAGKAGA